MLVYSFVIHWYGGDLDEPIFHTGFLYADLKPDLRAGTETLFG